MQNAEALENALLGLPDAKSIANVLWKTSPAAQDCGGQEFSSLPPSHYVFEQAKAVLALLSKTMRLGTNQDLPPGWARNEQGGLIPPVGAEAVAHSASGLVRGTLDEINAFQLYKSGIGEAAHYESDGLFRYSTTNSEYEAWLHRASIAAEMKKLEVNPVDAAATPGLIGAAMPLHVVAALDALIAVWDKCGAYPDTESERQEMHNAISTVRKALPELSSKGTRQPELSAPRLRAIAICDGGGYQDDVTAEWSFSDEAFLKTLRAVIAASERDIPVIAATRMPVQGECGWRPASCDRGLSGSACCSEGCAADQELAELARLRAVADAG